MTIREALAYIHAVDWRRSKPGLRRIHELLEKLGHPERTVRFVHVTGTNGKGSTCAMLASILQAAGYRTGLYTSPYIFRFNERMQVDGQEIPDEELCAITEEVRPLADSMADHPSEFEMVTAISFTWFARRKCDIVVCEVGMGGEFDATNAIPAPEAAVLCNIGLDHTTYLGDTVEKIAATKSGIIKPGCEAVLYPCALSVAEIVSARCRSCGVTLHPVDMDALSPLAHSLDGQAFNFGDLTDLHLPLLGRMQLYNAATALTVTEVLRRRGWALDQSDVEHGLYAVSWPGRFELCAEEPDFIVDGGHNPQCAETVAENLMHYFPDKKRVLLIGVLRDKDYEKMTEILAPCADEFVTVAPDSPRALSAEELAGVLSRFSKPVTPCASVAEAVDTAKELAGEDGMVCASGSLYLVGSVRYALGMY